MSAPLAFPAHAEGTSLVLLPDGSRLPVVARLGVGPYRPSDVAACTLAQVGAPLLAEHASGNYRRPGLRGYRPGTGDGWSTQFSPVALDAGDDVLVIDAVDAAAGLRLRTEIESLTGGALRARHTVTNSGATPYVVDGLDVSLPLPDRADELLDFTGRHERERSPQRHPVRDGLWLRETRRGRTGLESASILIAGPAGFGFGHGEVIGVHLGFSGNGAVWVERDPDAPPTIGGGELLLPGEIVLEPGESYSSPWLFVAAADDGLDSIAAALHTWQRALPAHPGPQPVLLNVWEAVYFDHDLGRLRELADRAARIGVERFVLDDGWFAGRRNDTAGLGDWVVDDTVWPQGLHPLVDHVHDLGMQFGLWFEPEMVNPDSDLYRAHPDWILSAGHRTPQLSRNQLVLDLTNPDVWTYLLEHIDALLTAYRIDYVKWDHNRDLLEPGDHAGRPAVHRQTLAFYALLDALRARHPGVDWESCASGGGRIDLGVLERVQRVWTSDMTDARSRQEIQRWTGQLVAPEYLGAHVSATRSHQTGRTVPLDFRAATALFGSFGIEWDLTACTDAELDELAGWVQRYQLYRPLLHSGRMVRVESSDPAVLLHGVVAADRRSALFAHVQLDESAGHRGVAFRMPYLDPEATYRLTWAAPIDAGKVSKVRPVHPDGPTGGAPVTGAALSRDGVVIPRRRPETVLLIHVEQI